MRQLNTLYLLKKDGIHDNWFIKYGVIECSVCQKDTGYRYRIILGIYHSFDSKLKVTCSCCLNKKNDNEDSLSFSHK